MNKKSTIRWATRLMGYLSFCIAFFACSERPSEFSLTPGDSWQAGKVYKDFILTGQALTEEGAEATLLFHTDGESGYEVLFHNGAIDGTDVVCYTEPSHPYRIDAYAKTRPMVIYNTFN